MTPEQKAAAYAANAEYQKRRRMLLSPEERREMRRQMWKKYHGDNYRLTAASYMRRKRISDPGFALAERLRARIKTAVRRAGTTKHQGTEPLTGCTKEHLRDWIKCQFEQGMGWDNRSQWHIDHIIPCCAFNLADEQQQRVAFHYTNLRPIWSHDNQRKGGKVPVVQQKLFWTLKDIADARSRLAGARHA
jgi:hypothetical protein